MLSSGAVKQPSKMSGRPYSRGRVSLNLLTDPQQSTKNLGTIPREKQARGSPRQKEIKKRKKKKKKKKKKKGRV
jgi:hypothetical protein